MGHLALAAAFVLVGVAVAGLGIGQGVGTVRFLRRACRTTGVVVGHQSRPFRSQRRTAYFPVVEFADRTGTVYRVATNTGTVGTPKYRDRSAIVLAYDPQNPADARIATVTHLWLVPAAMTVGGVATVGFGLLLYFVL